MVFERVFTITDFNDGPRSGIADFEGRPHLYECEWNESADSYSSTFRLSPITPEVLALALEDSAIAERWWIAFQEGLTTQETRPALPEERPRHDELQRLMDDRLRIDPANSVRVLGEFRSAAIWDGRGLAPVEVRWERCGELGPSKKTFATFWQRFAAMWIDFFVFVPLMVVYQVLEPFSKVAAAVLTILHGCLAEAYVIYGHGRFGKTVGKLAMRIRVVRVTGEPLRWREAWLRSAFNVCFMVVTTFGMVTALFAVADSRYYGVGWRARSENLEAQQPAWAAWAARLGMIWFYSEFVTMLFNKRRRALHDFIAGTVVVSERGSRPIPGAAEQTVAAGNPAAETPV